MLQDYKITDSEKAAIDSVTQKINNEKLYFEFVKFQEEGFKQVLEFINSTIFRLKEDYFISSKTTITARIKDLDSAMKNYNCNKMLDDIFGIEIVCNNDEELNWIKSTIEKIMISTKSKNFNKENGYKAQHESYYPDSKSEAAKRWKMCSDNVPIVELQFKTQDVAYTETASHHCYKERDQENVAEILKNNVLEIGRHLPKMWMSTDGFIRELKYEEIIQKIYPFIDLETIKKPETRNRV